MEGILHNCEFLRQTARTLKQERFTLVDIGCAGGLDPAWRQFGDRLRAVGFDPNIDECERLAANDDLPSTKYVAAFVGLPPDHPFALMKAANPNFENDPWNPLSVVRKVWNRLSVARTVEIRKKEIDDLPSAGKTEFNAWQQTRLADESHPVFLPDFFAEQHIDDIDFIKMDVDGRDFEILHSLEDVLADARVMGLGMEVNFVGSGLETGHTFHNTDRFMRKHGFDLFHLTVRHYSSAALPSRYTLPIPAQSEFGRPIQGDALYVRDLCHLGKHAFAATLSSEKILKTAAILAAFNLPDAAAEILLKFRVALTARCDVDLLLDTLAAQAQQTTGSCLSYKDYMAAFEQDNDLFYPLRVAASSNH